MGQLNSLETRYEATVEEINDRFSTMETEMNDLMRLTEEYSLHLTSNVTEMNTKVKRVKDRQINTIKATKDNFKVHDLY